jgi:hypothetical protein
MKNNKVIEIDITQREKLIDAINDQIQNMDINIDQCFDYIIQFNEWADECFLNVFINTVHQAIRNTEGIPSVDEGIPIIAYNVTGPIGYELTVEMKPYHIWLIHTLIDKILDKLTEEKIIPFLKTVGMGCDGIYIYLDRDKKFFNIDCIIQMVMTEELSKKFDSDIGKIRKIIFNE